MTKYDQVIARKREGRATASEWTPVDATDKFNWYWRGIRRLHAGLGLRMDREGRNLYRSRYHEFYGRRSL